VFKIVQIYVILGNSLSKSISILWKLGIFVLVLIKYAILAIIWVCFPWSIQKFNSK